MKNGFNITDNSIFYGDNLIYNSEHKLLASLSFDKFIVLVVDDNTNQNTISVDINGNIIWTIEKTEYHQASCPANNIYMDKGKTLIYRWCGIEEEIDTSTGKILSSFLIK